MKPEFVSTFYKNDAPAYAAGDNIRKIASYIDGFKLSARKIIYTLFEKYPNSDFVKTSQFANYVAGFTNYNQGENNLAGVCETLVQDFLGTNNYPLITGKGGWGNILDPYCAASRYTYVKANDNLKIFFNKDDRKLVKEQIYEGDKIEPLYYIPILPTLLLNGSDGLSTGFRQLILPRNIKDIVSYISKKLNGTKNPKIEFLPWYRNFKGSCRYNADGKIEILGKVDKNNATNYTISELPIGLSFSKYKEILEDLCDSKVIVDYIDKCDPKTNTILFEIKTTREFTVKYNDNEKLLTVFKLIKSYTEQLNCIDENNRVREFSSISEILDAFIEIRLSYYQKRKEYLITTTKKELDYLFSKYLFCKGVIDETINVRNVPNAKIIAQLEKIDKIIKVDDSYDYLLRIPIGSITKEGLEKLKKDITENKELYKLYKNKDYKEFWIDDLKELKEKIR